MFWLNSACLHFLGGFRKTPSAAVAISTVATLVNLFLLPFQVKRLEGSFELLLATLLLS